MKNGIRFLLFLLVFAVVFFAASFVLTPAKHVRHSAIQEQLNELPKDTIDVVFLGASTSWASQYPAVMWDMYGYTAYNYSSSVERSITSYYSLLNFMERQTPKVVVLDSQPLIGTSDIDNEREPYIRSKFDSMNFGRVKIRAAIEISSISKNQTAMSYLFPIFRYHDRWNETSKNDFVGEKAKTWLQADYMMGSYIDPRRNLAAKGMLRLEETKTENAVTSSLVWEYYQRIVDLCKKNDIEVIIYRAPVSLPVNRLYGEYMAAKEFADMNELTYLDFGLSNAIDVLDMDAKEDYYDAKHTNKNGAEKVSTLFASYLHEFYDLKDHRGDPQYQYMDDYALQYIINSASSDVSMVSNWYKENEENLLLQGNGKYQEGVFTLNSPKGGSNYRYTPIYTENFIAGETYILFMGDTKTIEGKISSLSLRLYDKQKKTFFDGEDKRIDWDKEQAWVFTVSDDADVENLELLVYAGRHGRTAGCEIEIEWLRLHQWKDADREMITAYWETVPEKKQTYYNASTKINDSSMDIDPVRNLYDTEDNLLTSEATSILVGADAEEKNAKKIVYSNLVPGETYLLCIGSAYTLQGAPDVLSAVLQDKEEDLITAHFFNENVERPQGWLFIVPEDIDADNTQLVFYAGNRGNTEGNTILYEDVALYNWDYNEERIEAACTLTMAEEDIISDRAFVYSINNSETDVNDFLEEYEADHNCLPIENADTEEGEYSVRSVWNNTGYAYRVISGDLKPGESYLFSVESVYVVSGDTKYATVAVYDFTNQKLVAISNIKTDTDFSQAWIFNVPEDMPQEGVKLIVYAGEKGKTQGNEVVFLRPAIRLWDGRNYRELPVKEEENFSESLSIYRVNNPRLDVTPLVEYYAKNEITIEKKSKEQNETKDIITIDLEDKIEEGNLYLLTIQPFMEENQGIEGIFVKVIDSGTRELIYEWNMSQNRRLSKATLFKASKTVENPMLTIELSYAGEREDIVFDTELIALYDWNDNKKSTEIVKGLSAIPLDEYVSDSLNFNRNTEQEFWTEVLEGKENILEEEFARPDSFTEISADMNNDFRYKKVYTNFINSKTYLLVLDSTNVIKGNPNVLTARVFDFLNQKTVFSRSLLPDSTMAQAWIFTIPQDLETEALFLILYAGEAGSTAGNIMELGSMSLFEIEKNEIEYIMENIQLISAE